MLFRWIVVFAFLASIKLCADVNSTTGSIQFLIDSRTTVAELTSIGLGIGVLQPSANLQVAGGVLITNQLNLGGPSTGSCNLNINGTIAYSMNSANQTCLYAGEHTVNLMDSSSGNFIFYLPNPNTIEGKLITLKKVNATNTAELRCIDPLYKFEGYPRIVFSNAFNSNPSVTLVASGGNFYILDALSASLTLREGPRLLKAEASDLTGGNTTLNNNDRLWLVFSEPTNQVAATTKAQIDALVDFQGSSLGTNYTGSWISADRLQLTISDASGGNLVIGANIAIKSSANLTAAAGDTLSCSNSVKVSGTWGGNIFVGSNLILWLDADDSSTFTKDGSQLVSQWRDKSGYGNHAIQGNTIKQPTWTTGGEQGRGVVSYTYGKTMVFPRFTTIRTVFWAIQETDHAKISFLLGDSLTYHFHRGYDVVGPTVGVLFSHLANAQVTSGNIRINGEPMPYTWVWATKDTIIISLVTNGPVNASQLFQDRDRDYYFYGNLGELLVYNTALSNAQINEIESYLINKWRGQVPKIMWASASDSDASSSALGTGDQLTILFNASTNQRSVAAKEDIDAILDLSGKSLGSLYSGVWSSANQLVITIQNATGGNLNVGDNLAIKSSANILALGGIIACSDNTLVLGNWGSGNLIPFYPSQISKLVLWADASVNTSVFTSGNNVMTWRDLSPNHNDLIGVATQYPVYSGNTRNGRPVISLNTNQYFKFPRIHNIRTVFWVLREYAPASHSAFLLGDEITYQFHRNGNILLFDTWAHVDAKNGEWRINGGSTIAPTITGISADTWRVISFVSAGTTTALQANAFSRDRDGPTYFKGELAELIIYDKILTTTERVSVENYLKAKWGL